MSNLVKHAEREMRLAGLYDEGSDYGGLIPEAVMELIRPFAAGGHSGGSAEITLELFERLSRFRALTPLTSDPNEWMDVKEYGPRPMVPLWQSARDSRCFSEDGGKTYYDVADSEKVMHMSVDPK
jgi:hypothetical protein